MQEAESEDSSNVAADEGNAEAEAVAEADVAEEADEEEAAEDDAAEDDAAEEDAAEEDAEDDKEKAHFAGIHSRSHWCVNNIVPCRDECCRLNWWGRRRCCYHKPWAPCCGGFQWHFPGYMVASTWKGAVPNNVGMHYHHGHPALAYPAASEYSHSHEHSH